MSAAFNVGAEVRGRDRPWEHGSELPLPLFMPEVESPLPWPDQSVLCGSGRTALQCLIEYGRRTRGWRRLWLPDYFCQDVLPPLRRTDIELRSYESAPFAPSAFPLPDSCQAGDVVLIVNIFGLQSGSRLPPLDEMGIEVIEDHTHDPSSSWALHSSADWCVASLRKTLPLADGGIIWSPRGHPLPAAPSVTAEHSRIVSHKLAGMALKALYLAGDISEKHTYREHFSIAERELGIERPSGISVWSRGLLPFMPIQLWRDRRRDNHALLRGNLVNVPAIQVLAPEGADASPSVCTLQFENVADRDSLRAYLIARSIFPAVLWPLALQDDIAVSRAALDLSNCLLSLHCDMRYSKADMMRVSTAVADWVASRQ